MCTYRVRYSIGHRDGIYVNAHGNLSFAKNMGKNISSKYGQKPVDITKSQQPMRSRQPQREQYKKTTEATGNLVGNAIAEKITKAL